MTAYALANTLSLPVAYVRLDGLVSSYSVSYTHLERAYYYARKIKWYQDANQVQVLEENYDYLLRFQEQVKDRMKKGLSRSFSKEKAGILEAMLLGEKGNMDKEDTLLFQILGCSHILAISGV